LNESPPEDESSRIVQTRLTDLIEKRITLARAHVNRIRERHKITNITSNRFVTHLFTNGRLGNWMFQAASLIGIARTNGRIPIIVKSQKLRSQLFSGFYLSLLEAETLFPSLDTSDISRLEVRAEMAAAKYNAATRNLNILCNCQNQTLVISGYLQSWKYFQDNNQEIRQTFTLRRGILNAAKNEVLNALGKMKHEKLTDVTLVGIHVRRGDHLNADMSSIGHIPATDSYLLRTTQYMAKKYSNVVFFVVSDDVAYCQNLFRGENFALLQGNKPEVDMAVLTLMDRVILSVGTFGWWGAFLSDATEVIHFKDWPKNGSTFDGMLNKADFFPPSWVAWS
jgi:galactoside 2-L-fucosyltransferase 1/2